MTNTILTVETFNNEYKKNGGYEKLLKEYDLLLRLIDTVKTNSCIEPITSLVDIDQSAVQIEINRRISIDHISEQIVNEGVKDIGNKILGQIANDLSNTENTIHVDGPNNIEDIITSIASKTRPDVCILGPNDSAKYRIHKRDYSNEKIPIITKDNNTVCCYSKLCTDGTAYVGKLETLQMRVQNNRIFEIDEDCGLLQTVGYDVSRIRFRSYAKIECTDLSSWTRIIFDQTEMDQG